MAEYNPSKIIKDGNTYNFRDTTKIPLAGSNEISGSLIPSTDGTVDLGGPSYQWNNAYIKSLTINGVACGDILTHNASEFVNVTSAQTIGGAKTFYTAATAYPIIKLKTAFIEQGLYDSDNLRGVAFRCADKNDAILGDFGYKTERTGEVGSYFSARTKVNNTQITREVKLRFKPGSTDCELVPDTTNAIDLGTSNYKWKSFNGVEPSDLSLPSDTFITIDTTGFAWGANFTFTPSVNGYLFISIASSAGTRKLSLKTGRGEYYFSNQTVLRFTMPVYKDKLVTILVASSITETVVPTMTLFPLQGNI